MRPVLLGALGLVAGSSIAIPARAQSPDGGWGTGPGAPVVAPPSTEAPPPASGAQAAPAQAAPLPTVAPPAPPSPPHPAARAPLAPTRAELVPPAWTRDRDGVPRRRIPAEEGVPTPPGYVDGTRSTLGLLVPGLVLLPLGYASSLFTSLTCGTLDAVAGARRGDCGTTDWALGALPLAGPVLIAVDPEVERGWRTGYALYAAAQHAGLALIITGAAVRQKVWNLRPEHRQRAWAPQLDITPGGVDVSFHF